MFAKLGAKNSLEIELMTISQLTFIIPGMKDPITFDDFMKLELRVGTIVEASSPDWSKKLLRFVVDFGEEIGKKIIFSGIKDWYTPEEFIGKQYPFLLNL